MEFEIAIPETLWELLQEEALRRNTTAEEITAIAIKNFIERNGENN